MPWDGNGNPVLNQNFPADRDAGPPDSYIQANLVQNETENIRDMLANCLTRDGQNSASADLPMGGQKHTNVGDATATSHYATAGQVQKGSFSFLTSVAGTADAIEATGALGISSLTNGMLLWFVPTADNTAAATIKINTIAAQAITKQGGAALAAGDIKSGWPALLLRVSGGFELLNPYTVLGAQIDAASVTAALINDALVNSMGFRGVPHNNQNEDYTLVASDAGKLIRCNSSTGRTFTIPPHSSVAFPVGTVINIRNVGSASLTLAPDAGVTLRLAGTSTTGSRSIVQYGEVSLRKDDTDIWYVSGAGLT